MSRASCRAIDSVPELVASASSSFCCSSASCAAACSCFLAVSACSLLNLCCSLAPLCTDTKPSDFDYCKAISDTARCCSDPCMITISNRSRLHQADTVTELHRLEIQTDTRMAMFRARGWSLFTSLHRRPSQRWWLQGRPPLLPGGPAEHRKILAAPSALLRPLYLPLSACLGIAFGFFWTVRG